MKSTTPRKPLTKPFSEVIYSTNELIIAQCYKEISTDSNEKPKVLQGKIAKVKSSYDTSYATFGLITKINNSSIDNIHKPSALGLSPNELEALQPQVYDLLRKELEIHLFAYEENEGLIFNVPPPNPMQVHDFVYFASDSEILKLTEEFSNLAGILKKNQLNLNLLVDLINTGYMLRNKNYDYLVKTAQELSITFSEEVHSLMLLLKRISPSQ